MSLNQVLSGKKVRILEIQAGMKLLKRLSNIGIYKGSVIVVEKNLNGKLLLKVNETKIALGFGQALKIFVEEIA